MPGFGEERDRLVAAREALFDRQILLNDPPHLLLDLRKVFGRDRLVEADVVVEAVFDRRTDSQARAGVEAQHRLSHDVRARVPDDLLAFGIVEGQHADLGAVGEGCGEISGFALHKKSKSALAQLVAQPGNEIVTGRARLERSL